MPNSTINLTTDECPGDAPPLLEGVATLLTSDIDAVIAATLLALMASSRRATHAVIGEGQSPITDHLVLQLMELGIEPLYTINGSWLVY